MLVSFKPPTSGIGTSPLLAQCSDMSGVGTFRTCGDVRVESVMRSKADVQNNLKAAQRWHDP
jgi:hypothetical protein